MKISLKLLLSTIVVMALALGFSGFYFVNYVFETSLAREVGQAADESNILSFAFETAALTVPARYSVLPDNTVEEIASNLERSGRSTNRLIRISDEQKEVLHTSDGFDADEQLLQQTWTDIKTYRIIETSNGYYIHTCASINSLGRILYLETMKDISDVFTERAMGFSLYRKVTLVMLLIGTGIMHLIASLLTKPIRLLTRATRRMAEGDYAYRARQVSNDELGQLTRDFNHMANALEENIEKLEEENEAKEEFMGAFAHELKTPLTAIIGYADMLRTHKLDEEKSFLSANYIYTEGKRLEAMSFRLLDIIVAKKDEAELSQIAVAEIFEYLREMFAEEKRDMKFVFRYDDGTVWAEVNLIKTVLVNLIDNACKASEAGSTVTVRGRKLDAGYRFEVEDEGIGIPVEEQRKITKAFYMVDKSRSRSKNGAGLGLALCEEILKIHHSELTIQSEQGKGSCIGFTLEGNT
ncbi:MAG: HAMP domain-containing histidine kinase [Lachnospiraceae bacterium]|nr:HAMP domain-containing histidine kinase [Lachnospiraceae bacterium]MDE7273117.1 HAMP domain-containing histidine kinase [Lachnospiraceae bacterium]